MSFINVVYLTQSTQIFLYTDYFWILSKRQVQQFRSFYQMLLLGHDVSKFLLKSSYDV